MVQHLGISLAHATMHERVSMAERADRAGFESIWVEDGDAFVAIASMAHVVKQARMGTGIARAFTRSPLVTATASANLQELTDGRFVLGLGTGTKRQNLFQIGQEFDHPATRVAELVDLLRNAWGHDAESQFHYEGKFNNVTWDGPNMHRAHTEKPIPVYLAAVNDYMLQTAGRAFDGLAGHPCFTPPYLEQVVSERIGEGLAKAGRTRDSFTLASWVITSIDSDRGLARKRAAYQIGYYLSTKSYQFLLDWHGWGAQKDPIRDAFFAGDWEALAAAVTDDMIDTMAVAGTANDAIDQISRFQQALDVPILYSHAAGPARADAGANLDRILKTFGA